MSKKEKVTEQKEQKVMTKYDQKMQKREELKKKQAKEERRSKLIGVVVVAALVCLIASFPIRTYMVLNQTYITIGDEEITQLEFDYNYNVTKNNYYNQYGSYMSYFGVDFTQDLSTQMYSDTLSWKDLLEEMTVDNLIESKSIKAQAEATGFTYDADEEFKIFKENVKASAAAEGVSVRDYVRAVYGSYATLSRIEDIVKENITISAYYNQISDEKAATDEEIQEYYDNNVDNYESVDYRLTTIVAELPEQPTDDDITKAMEEARVLADEAANVVTTEGELIENVTKADTTAVISEWLFDGVRVPGEVTVIEDKEDCAYYVLAFENRYLDETPSANARIIFSEETPAEDILNEWKSGAATEDSFIEICAEYSADSTASSGGLYEGLVKAYTPDELDEWLYDESRVAGDTTAIAAEDGSYEYVLYYVGQNDPKWKLDIRSTLLEETMTEYLAEISEGMEVNDPKGKLNYLKVQAETSESETSAE